MLLAIVAVVAGLYLLTRAADLFVAGAARLSTALRVPAVVIGAVVVGFGTSAPELVVSAVSAGQDKLDIAVGNIIGSNVANLTLILGVAALLCIMHVDSAVLKREAPLSIAATGLFALFVQDGLARWEGAVLLGALVLALALIFVGSRDGNDELVAEVEEFVDDAEAIRIGRETIRTVVGLVGVVVAAQLTVWGASDIADEIGLGQGFVGLTLVAIGTSLPELVTSVAAARKGEHELIIGNLLGSNLFNSLAVGGVSATIGPGALVDASLAGAATGVMLLAAVGSWLLMATGRRVVRWEALVLLGGYALSIPLMA